jgi:ankyrin repeat protein
MYVGISAAVPLRTCSVLTGIYRFQWAFLQTSYLLSLERHNAIREKLGSLPKDLKHAYDEIFERIESSDDLAQIASRAFQLIICSKEMSGQALVAAVCQDPLKDETQPVDISIDTVLSACHNLLVFDQAQNTFRSSHLSVLEYIEDNHYSCSQGNALVAKVCPSLLKNPENWHGVARLDKTYDPLDPPLEALLRYATNNWATHVQHYERYHEGDNIDPRLSKLLQEFLGASDTTTPAYRAWYTNGKASFLDSAELEPVTSTLFAICYFGFYRTLSSWWDNWCWDLEQKNQNGNSLLYLATERDSSIILKKLIALGADFNTKRAGLYGSALARAAGLGNERNVKLLLEAGADVNMKLARGYGSALATAVGEGSYGSNQEITKLLLKAGADVNMKLTGGFGSALAAAATGGFRSNQENVKLLLQAGADVNMKLAGRYGSALAAAVALGSEKNVKLLLNAEADVNMRLDGIYYQSALDAASDHLEEKRQALLSLLCEKGANWDYLNDYYTGISNLFVVVS